MSNLQKNSRGSPEPVSLTWSFQKCLIDPLVKLISETVKNRGNLSTYYQKHLTKSIQQEKNIKIGRKIKIVYTAEM